MNVLTLSKRYGIRPGDIIGTRGPLMSISTITAWRQAGPLEAIGHRRVATHILGCTGNNLYTEATLPTVREVTAGELAKYDNVVFLWRPYAAHDIDKTVEFVRKQIGVKYDTPAWGAMYGIGQQSKARWYCSELWAAGLATGGYAVPPEWQIGCFPWAMQQHAEVTGDMLYRNYTPWWK